MIRGILLCLSSLLLLQRVLGASLLDPSFQLDPQVQGQIDDVRVRPDGRILIAGNLSLSGGIRVWVVRLTSSGQLDTSFHPVADDSQIPSGSMKLAVTPAGDMFLSRRLWLGWPPNSYSEVYSSEVYSISADGRELASWRNFPALVSLTPLTDGKIMVWGTQSWVEGTAVFSKVIVERRFATGEVDPEFSVIDGLLGGRPNWSAIMDLSECRNGDLLLAGDFTQERYSNSVLRIARDGAAKWAFQWPANRDGADYAREDPDGQVIAVGQGNMGLNRLHPDGSLEKEAFCAPFYWRSSNPSLLLADGRLLDSGPFTNVAGLKRPGLVCLQNDGSVDLRFDPGHGIQESQEIRAMTQQPDGRILIAGNFTSFDGMPAPGIARLFGANPDPVRGPVNLFYFQPLSRAAECGEPFQVRLTRAGNLDATHQVGARTIPITAVSGVDYVPLDTNLVFLPGERFKTVTISMKADLEAEGAETLKLAFSPVVPFARFTENNYLQIEIEDSGCVVRFETNHVFINEGDPTAWTSVNPAFGAAVRVRSQNLSAQAGLDYAAIDRLVGFTPAGYTASIPLQNIDNAVADGERSFLVEFVDEGKGFIFGSPSNVVVTIRDNDTPLGPARNINGTVESVHSLPDREWLLAGSFDRVDGLPRPGLARFGPDGSFDPGFNPPGDLVSGLPVVAAYPDGRVLVAGKLRSDLDFAGSGIIRLERDGAVDPTFHLETIGEFAPGCLKTSNAISQVLIESGGGLIVSGQLPRFSDCAVPAQIVRFSALGKLEDQWLLPSRIGPVRYTQAEIGGSILATGSLRVVRLLPGGGLKQIFDPTSPYWNGYVGPVSSLNPDSTWIETEIGVLREFSADGSSRATISRVTVGGETLQARQFASVTTLDSSRLLVSGMFGPVNNTAVWEPWLLVLDAFGNVLHGSRLPTVGHLSGLRSVAINDGGEVAGVCSLGYFDFQPRWLRFSSDLRPAADLAIDTVAPAGASGVFLRLRGQAPNGYSVETSDDLKTWRPGPTRPEINWGQTFLDPEPVAEGYPRFYRARF